MFRRMAGNAVVLVLTVYVATACGGEAADEAKPSGQVTPSSVHATTTTSAARVFDPPKAFVDKGVRITRDHGALVGPELAYTPVVESEDTGPSEPTLAVQALSLADGEKRWEAPTPVQHRLGLRGHNGYLRLTKGTGPLRLVWAGVHRLEGTGTQQDRFELMVGAFDAATGQKVWSVQLPLTGDTDWGDSDVTVVGAEDAHAAVAISRLGDEPPISGAIVNVQAGTIIATPPDFQPIGLDGQIVVGLRSTGLSSAVPQGLDVATSQPRWTADIRVDDLFATVVMTGLAHFVEDELFDSKSLLVNTADGTVKATLARSDECSPAAPDVVICVGHDQVTALDLTGKVLWSLPDQTVGRIKPAVTAVYAGLVYGSANGGVILDARTGKDLVTSLDWVPDDIVPGYGIGRDDTDGLTSHRATG